MIAGVGTAGILVSITISIIQRTPHEKRGLLLGLTNTGMTVGVSLGAVVAGALEPKIGWVGAHTGTGNFVNSLS